MNNFYLRFNHDIWQTSLTIEEKLIVNFIWNFQIKSGACYAADGYIAEVFNLNVTNVSKLVAKLAEEKHIKILESEPRRLMVVNHKLYPVSE